MGYEMVPVLDLRTIRVVGYPCNSLAVMQLCNGEGQARVRYTTLGSRDRVQVHTTAY